MTQTVNFNGTNYSIPEAGELNWASLTDFLVAVGNYAATTTFVKFATRIATTSPVTVVSATDAVILTDLTVAGAVAVSLPAGVANQVFVICDKKGDAATNNITITPNGAETINGAANYVIRTNRESVIIVFKSGNWTILKRATVTVPSTLTNNAIMRWDTTTNDTKNTKVAVDDSGAGAFTSTLYFAQTANRSVTFPDTDLTVIGRTEAEQGASRITNKDLDDTTTRIVDSSDTTKKIALDAGGTTGTTTTIAATQTANRTVTTPDATTTLLGHDTAQVVTNKDIDGGTASNTSRITIPKAAKTTLDGLTRKEATLVYASDTDTLYADNGTALVAVGSGSGAGELNVITNPSATTDTTGWSAGTNHTVTRLTSGSPLDPTIPTAFRAAKTSASATTESSTSGVYSAFTLPVGLESKKLKVEFYCITPATGTWKLSVYDGTTRLPLSTDSSSVTTLPVSFTGKFTAYFDTTTNNTYTVSLTETAGVVVNLDFTSMIVGPGIQPAGAAIGEWQSYTPTTTSGSKTFTNSARYRRVGSAMEIIFALEGNATASGGGSTKFQMSIPSGFTIDTAQLPNSTITSIQNVLGFAVTDSIEAVTSVDDATAVTAYTTTTVAFIRTSTQTQYDLDNINAARAESFRGRVMVPIAEWAGSGTVNVAQNDVEYAFNTSTATASNDTTSFGYGPAGAQIQVITTALVRTVRFQTPIQATDQMTVQVSDDRTKWVDLGPMLNAAGTARIMPYQVQNGTQYGLGEIQVQNATDITVRFGVYSYQGASYGGSGDSWTTPGLMYWRVVKSKSGQAVGFGEVAQNSSGLVKSAGQLKGTNTNDVAATGYVGEVLQSSTSATNFTTSAQYQDAASVTLTAGMWAIYGLMRFTRNGSTFSVTPTAVVGVSTSSGNSGTGLSNGISYTDINNVNTGTTWTAFTLNTPALIVKNDGTTITRVNDGVAYAAGQTLYLKAYIDTFTSGNPQFAGSIMAVRIR